MFFPFFFRGTSGLIVDLTLPNPSLFFFFIFINIFPPFILPFLIFGQGNLGFPTPAPLCFYRWVTWNPCFPSIKKRVLKEITVMITKAILKILSYFRFTSCSFDDERARHFASPFFPLWGLFFTLRARFSSILLHFHTLHKLECLDAWM